MINFEKFTLSNGLRVLVHQDQSTPMVAVDILYNIGAKDENPERTGFAHLFEHLMFGGSLHIPDYDTPLQDAGGENNAYTTNDFTNYYLQLPKENIETAFWLESDRMLSLAFSKKSLEVQRKVVCEEFKEHYINKPYGDVWKIFRSLCYQEHPYQWMTIGKELSHIEKAELKDVKDFFFKYYRPRNAVLCVAGNIDIEEMKDLAEYWFGPIEGGEKINRTYPQESPQIKERRLRVERNVPAHKLLKAFHMPDRLSPEYYTCDLITEILAGGKSTMLYNKLVKENKLFTNIDCYHTGSTDAGLIVFDGTLNDDVSMENAESALNQLIEGFVSEGTNERELLKAKNKIESMIAFEDLSLISRANNLAFFETIFDDAQEMNREFDKYNAINTMGIQEVAGRLFKKENSNTLEYIAAH